MRTIVIATVALVIVATISWVLVLGNLPTHVAGVVVGLCVAWWQKKPAEARPGTRRTPSARSSLPAMAVGVIITLACVLMVVVIGHLVPRGFPWLRDRYHDRDRPHVEQQLLQLEQREQWTEALTVIHQRELQPLSARWREGLRQRAALLAARQSERSELQQVREQFQQAQQRWRQGETLHQQQLHQIATAYHGSLLDWGDEQQRDFVLAKERYQSALNIAEQYSLSPNEAAAKLQALVRPRPLPAGAHIRVLQRETEPWPAVEVAIDTASGEAFTGLQRADCAARQDERWLTRWDVVSSEHTTQVASIVLCLDRSGSMQGPAFQALQQGAERFVSQAQQNADMALLSFGDEVMTERLWTRDVGLLHASISQLKAGGGTALGQAIRTATQTLAAREGRRVLVVFTDGQDSSGTMDVAALSRDCRQQQVTVFGVMLKANGIDPTALQQLTQATGGLLVNADRYQDLATRFDTLALELRRPAYRFVFLDADPRRPITLYVGGSPSTPLQIEFAADEATKP